MLPTSAAEERLSSSTAGVCTAVAWSSLRPALTVPAGSPTALIDVTVAKNLMLFATPALAPATVSVCAAPSAPVPVISNSTAASLPVDVMVTFRAGSSAAAPPLAREPPRASAPLLPTSAAEERPSSTAASTCVAGVPTELQQAEASGAVTVPLLVSYTVP